MKKYLVLLLLAAALMGCEKGEVSQNLLVGTWKLTEYKFPGDSAFVPYKGEETILSFAEDGKFAMKGIFGEYARGISYRIGYMEGLSGEEAEAYEGRKVLFLGYGYDEEINPEVRGQEYPRWVVDTLTQNELVIIEEWNYYFKFKKQTGTDIPDNPQPDDTTTIPIDTTEIEMNGFKITVDSITETSAFTRIESTDALTYFSVALYTAKDLEKYSADSLAANSLEEIRAYLNYGYSFAQLAQYGVVSLGSFEHSWSGLPTNTDIVVIAFQILEKSGELSVGKLASLTFRTKDVTISARKNIEVVDGWFKNAIKEDGWYSFGGYSKDSAEYIYFYTYKVTSLNDVLNDETFDTEYSILYVWAGEDYDQLSVTKVNLRPSYNESTKELNISGTFIASNNTEYTLTFNGTEDVAGAPVRNATKKIKTNKEIKLAFGTMK